MRQRIEVRRIDRALVVQVCRERVRTPAQLN